MNSLHAPSLITSSIRMEGKVRLFDVQSSLYSVDGFESWNCDNSILSVL